MSVVGFSGRKQHVAILDTICKSLKYQPEVPTDLRLAAFLSCSECFDFQDVLYTTAWEAGFCGSHEGQVLQLSSRFLKFLASRSKGPIFKTNVSLAIIFMRIVSQFEVFELIFYFFYSIGNANRVKDKSIFLHRISSTVSKEIWIYTICAPSRIAAKASM